MPVSRSIPEAFQCILPSPSTQTIVAKPSTALPNSLTSIVPAAVPASADSRSERNNISAVPVPLSKREARVQSPLLSAKRPAIEMLVTNRGEKKSRKESKTDKKKKKPLQTSKLKRKAKKKKRSLGDDDMDDIFASLCDD